MPDQPKTWDGNLSCASLATVNALLQYEYLTPSLLWADIHVVYAGVSDVQQALKTSYLPEMTPEIYMGWAFSLRPTGGG